MSEDEQPPRDPADDRRNNGHQSGGAADPNGLLLARLAQLERAFNAQSERLRAIEQRLGLADSATEARPFAQGAKPAPTAPRPTPEDARPDSAARDSLRATTSEQAAATSTGWQAADSSGNQAGDPATEQAAHASGDAPPYTPLWNLDETAAQAGAAAASGAGAHRRSTGAPETETPSVMPARRDFEQLIGGSLFNWLGIIAVTLTVGFFLKYAFENQWVGARGRVLLGGFTGVAILAFAERLRARGYRSYAYVLSGGGILILYLSVYAARVFYDLIGVLPAFLLMVAVTTTAVLLSARYNAYAIAVLGLIGGFMTPVLLSTGVDNQIGLFGYIALLNSGVLALAYFKRWRSLNHLAFILTVITFAGWGLEHYESWKLWRTLFFLTLFFLMFSALGVIYNVIKQRPARWFDISLIISNATLYFATCYALLDLSYLGSLAALPGHHPLLGSFALTLSGFYVLLFYFTYQRHRADKLLTFSYVGAAVTFFTMAVAIQLDQHWVTIAWAVEGLMLTWIGLRADTNAPRYAALAVFFVALSHWFEVDLLEFTYRANETFVPLLNRRAVSAAALVATMAGVVWLYRQRDAERVDRNEREIITTLFILMANVLALTLLTVDVNDYFNARRARALAETGTFDPSLNNTWLFSLTVLWTLYGAAALSVGLVRRLLPLRIGALIVLGITILKLVTIDVSYYSAPYHLFVFNQTFIAFAVMVLALAFVVRLYARGGAGVKEGERKVIVPVLIAFANLLAVTGLSVEAMGYFNRSKSLAWATNEASDVQWQIARDVENTKQLILSFIWTAYASVAFTLGLRRGRQVLRVGALALLAVAGLKILLLDARFYDSPLHLLLFNQTFAAFAFFVFALWYIARLYAGAPEGVGAEELRLARPALTIVANLFALVALSLEASGYFNSQLRDAALSDEDLRDLALAQGLSLSVVWTLYGGAMLLYGHRRGNRLLRIMALLLLTATTFKVFFLDLAALEKFYRIVSFMVLGAILLAVSFLYQQKQRAAKAEGG